MLTVAHFMIVDVHIAWLMITVVVIHAVADVMPPQEASECAKTCTLKIPSVPTTARVLEPGGVAVT